MSENVSTTTVTESVDPSGNGDGLESLPESWQKEIRRLRAEGQSKGQRITALEGELTTARNDFATKEAAFTQQISESALNQARYRAAVTSGVPADRIDDFASRLRGSTPEELASDAANLAELFQTNTTPTESAPSGIDPSQGFGNSRQVPVTPAEYLSEMVRGQLGRT